MIPDDLADVALMRAAGAGPDPDVDYSYTYPPHKWGAQPGHMPTVADIHNERNHYRARCEVLASERDAALARAETAEAHLAHIEATRRTHYDAEARAAKAEAQLAEMTEWRDNWRLKTQLERERAEAAEAKWASVPWGTFCTILNDHPVEYDILREWFTANAPKEESKWLNTKTEAGK